MKQPSVMPAKGWTLPNGNRLNHGQLFLAKGNTLMSKQQQQKAMLRAMRRGTPGAAPNTATGTIARTGIDKVLPEAPIAHGMTRQTKPSHEFLHGQAVDDEVADKLSATGRNVPTAYGMGRPDRKDGDVLRDKHEPDLGSAILKQGALLSGKRADG
jgi:hypothetical protein